MQGPDLLKKQRGNSDVESRRKSRAAVAVAPSRGGVELGTGGDVYDDDLSEWDAYEREPSVTRAAEALRFDGAEP